MKSNSTDTTDDGTGTLPSISELSELSGFEKARLAGFTLAVLAVLGLAVVVLGELFTLLVLGWTAGVGAELGIHRLHVMVIGTTILTILLGVLVQLYRPTRQAASILGAFVGVGLAALVTVGAGEPIGPIVPFLVLIGLATLLHPAGRQLLGRDRSYSPAMLALVTVAAVPLVAFSLAQAGLQLGSSDPHAAAGHYAAMAQFGLVPLGYATLAALGMRGWRVAAWVGALPVAYYGLLSVSFTAQAGSTGVVWGAGAVLWAAGFVAVAEYSREGTFPALRRSAAGGD